RQTPQHADRLGRVSLASEAEPSDLAGRRARSRESEDRHAATLVAQRAKHAVPVHAGEHQVENDEIGPAASRAREALRPVLHDIDVVAFYLEVVAQPVGEVGIVLDDEDPLHAVTPASARSCSPSGASSACGMSGRSITKRATRPGASYAQTRPSCRATSSRTTERPMPVPAPAEPRSRSSRQ